MNLTKRYLFNSLVCVALVVALVGSTAHAHKLNPDVIEYLTGEKIDNKDTHDTETANGDPRGHDRTYYSFPEWYIVYSAQEYGSFVTNGGLPSEFPYFAAIGQMWEAWSLSEQQAERSPDSTTNAVLWTIAISFTIEYAIIGLYENTIGWLSEIFNFKVKTVEDIYTDTQAVAYGEFLNKTPWYDFPYGGALIGLWKTYDWSSLTPRGFERRTAFSIGYGLKALYAALIGSLSGGAISYTTAVVRAPEEIVERHVTSNTLVDGATNLYQVTLPRYRAFLSTANALALDGADFITIQGHDTIALSVVAAPSVACIAERDDVMYSMSILTESAERRYLLSVPVPELAMRIREFADCGVSVEHIYDF